VAAEPIDIFLSDKNFEDTGVLIKTRSTAYGFAAVANTCSHLLNSSVIGFGHTGTASTVKSLALLLTTGMMVLTGSALHANLAGIYTCLLIGRVIQSALSLAMYCSKEPRASAPTPITSHP
jgi:hypothetical protein